MGALKGFLKAAIAILILVVVFQYASYKRWLNTGFDDMNIVYNDGNEKQDDGGGSSEPKDVDYKLYYNKVDYHTLENNFGSEFTEVYYSPLGVSYFSNKYYLYISIMNIINKEINGNCNYNREIPSMEVDMKAKEIFGSINVEKKSFETLDKGLTVTYDTNKDSYIVKTNKCSDFDFRNGGIYTIVIDSKTEVNYLYVYEKALYLDYSQDSVGNMVFNYHANTDKDSRVIANFVESINYDIVPTYIYVFKKDGNNYIFQGVRNS